MQDDRAARRVWFARFVLPHEPALRRHLGAWRLPPDLELEDVIQEAYAKLASLPSVDSIRNPRNYFYQVARTIILEHIRRSKVVPINVFLDFEDLELSADAPDPETEVSDNQRHEHLRQVIAELDEPLRAVFQLRVVEELSFQMIGKRQRISENAAQKTFARALKFLVSRLGHGAGAAPPSSGKRSVRRTTGTDVQGKRQLD